MKEANYARDNWKRDSKQSLHCNVAVEIYSAEDAFKIPGYISVFPRSVKGHGRTGPNAENNYEERL